MLALWRIGACPGLLRTGITRLQKIKQNIQRLLRGSLPTGWQWHLKFTEHYIKTLIIKLCSRAYTSLPTCDRKTIHTLRVHYAHAAANLNSGYSKYEKVARVHYFCTIALRTSCTVLMRAWASRRVDLRERRIDLFSERVIVFCW